MNNISLYTFYTIYAIAKFSLQADFSRFIAIAFGLFLANLPLLRFIIGVRQDRGWILSVMGIENNHVISKSKARMLMDSSPLVGFSCLFFLFEEWPTMKLTFTFIGITFWIFLVSCMITHAMGSYIYWISRINNDPKLKSNAQDNAIREQSIEFAKLRYNEAYFFIFILFVSLVVYFFIDCFYQISLSEKIGYVVYFVLLFNLSVLSLIPGKIYNKNLVMLNIFQSEHLYEQIEIVEISIKKQLFFMKYLFALFILMEVIILPVITRVFL